MWAGGEEKFVSVSVITGAFAWSERKKSVYLRERKQKKCMEIRKIEDDSIIHEPYVWEYINELYDKKGEVFGARAYLNYSIIDTDPSLEQEYLEDKDIQESLDAFGLDSRKFWYLCLCVKYLASREGLVFIEDDDPQSTPGKCLELIMDKLNQFIKKEGQGCSIEFKIKEEKDILKVTSFNAFFIIHDILEYYLNEFSQNPALQLLLGSRCFSEKFFSKTKFVTNFTVYMDEFFKSRGLSKTVKKGRRKYHTRDLIASMIYTLRIDHNSRYIDEGKDYLKTLIAQEINKVDPNSLFRRMI